MKVLVDGNVVADSEDARFLDKYYYFPKKDINMELLLESNHRTECPWKGIASYFHVQVNGKIFENIAWSYPECKVEAKIIEGYIAFWDPAIVFKKFYVVN